MKLHPDHDALWQRPKKVVHNKDPVWFDKAPIGRDPLNNSMKNLSKNASLSNEYKNHSIRATVVTNLDNKGFKARHIMATTGHKSEISIKNYSCRCPTTKRKQMFDALNENFASETPEPVVKKRRNEPSSTVSAPDIKLSSDHNTDANFNLAGVKLETINENDFSDIFAMDDNIEEDEVLKIITQIEKENSQNLDVEVAKPQPEPVNQGTSNMINISNVQQRLHNMVRNMNFPHSNVTINYHFHA